MATTTNYGWTTPDDTALVKDGASAIRTLGTSVDTTTKALNPSTTLGDIEYRSSTANTNTRLGLGTAGQVLQVNSGATAPEWVTPAASAGMTLISTTTLSGASVTLSSIPSTYVDLRLVIRNFRPATDTEQLVMRINGDATANRHRETETYGGLTAEPFNTTRIIISNNSDNGASLSTIQTTLYDYANTATWKTTFTTGITVNQTTATNFNSYTATGSYNQTTAISSLVLFPLSGNFTSGTVLLYGVK